MVSKNVFHNYFVHLVNFTANTISGFQNISYLLLSCSPGLYCTYSQPFRVSPPLRNSTTLATNSSFHSFHNNPPFSPFATSQLPDSANQISAFIFFLARPSLQPQRSQPPGTPCLKLRHHQNGQHQKNSKKRKSHIYLPFSTLSRPTLNNKNFFVLFFASLRQPNSNPDQMVAVPHVGSEPTAGGMS